MYAFSIEILSFIVISMIFLKMYIELISFEWNEFFLKFCFALILVIFERDFFFFAYWKLFCIWIIIKLFELNCWEKKKKEERINWI